MKKILFHQKLQRDRHNEDAPCRSGAQCIRPVVGILVLIHIILVLLKCRQGKCFYHVLTIISYLLR